MKKKLSVVVISITPFDEKGRFDEKAYRKHLGRLREAGVSVYVCGGGSGEAYTFTPEERDRVLAIAVEELKGKVPVRAMGCEPRLHSDMVDFMKAAERAKVDAAQIFSLEIGHGAKPTPAEQEFYYRTVIESTSIPIYLSSHEASGYHLSLDVVENLIKRYPQIKGIAYGGRDMIYLSDLIRRVSSQIEVHCAGPAMGMSVMGLGGNGFMGNEGNLTPKLVQSVIDAYSAGDMASAQTRFSKLMAFNKLNTEYGGSSAMRAMKPLLRAFGLPGGFLRSPRLPLTGPRLEELIKLTAALNLPGVPQAVDPAYRVKKGKK